MAWVCCWFSPLLRLRVFPHFSSLFSLPAACRLFSHGLIFTRAHVLLALLSLRKNGRLLVVYPLLPPPPPPPPPQKSTFRLNGICVFYFYLFISRQPNRTNFKFWKKKKRNFCWLQSIGCKNIGILLLSMIEHLKSLLSFLSFWSRSFLSFLSFLSFTFFWLYFITWSALWFCKL